MKEMSRDTLALTLWGALHQGFPTFWDEDRAYRHADNFRKELMERGYRIIRDDGLAMQVLALVDAQEKVDTELIRVQLNLFGEEA